MCNFLKKSFFSFYFLLIFFFQFFSCGILDESSEVTADSIKETTTNSSNSLSSNNSAKSSTTSATAKTASGQNALNAHVFYLGQFRHMKGYANPYKNHCTDCHGKNLEGGAGPSCSKCHRSKWPYDSQTEG